MFKFLFSALVISVLLVASSAIGIQAMNDPKKGATQMNQNFLIAMLVFGVLGIILSFAGGVKAMRS